MNIIPKIILPAYAIWLMGILLGVQLKDIFNKTRAWTIPYLLVVILINIIIFVKLGNEQFGKLIFFAMHLPTILFFYLITQHGKVKIFFVFLTALLSCAIPAAGIKFLQLWIKPFSLTSEMIVYFLICATILWSVTKYFMPSFSYMLQFAKTKDFAKFTILPLVCSIYFFLIGGKSFSIPQEELNLATALILSVCVASYFLLVIIFRRTRELQILLDEKKVLMIQSETAKKQMVQLKVMQEQAVVYRHDMRHHIALLSSYAANGELDKIKDYLHRTEISIDSITPVRYCKNETVNLILIFFAEKAKKENVELIIDAAAFENTILQEPELCTLLSNGLENAITAAAGVKEKSLQKVWLTCKKRPNKVLILMENHFVGDVTIEDGIPKSNSKEHGLGTKSIALIVKKYQGYVAFETSANLFTLKIVLPQAEVICS